MSPFRLEALLRVRRLQQDAAAAAAGAAGARAAAARQQTSDVRDELAGASFAPRGDGLSFAAAVAARSASTSRYLEALTLAEQAGDRASAAQDAWTEQRRRARALERLADQHAAAQAEADLRAEQAVLDEHAGRTRTTTTTDPESAR